MSHAPHGPSSLKASELCPAKWRMEQGREDESSSYALRGSHLHSVAEARLTNGDSPAGDLTQEEKELVDIYVSYCRGLSDRFEVEVRVAPLPHIEHLIWGTADFVGFSPRKLHVADLKTGAGVPVAATGNLQLAAYGLGALEQYDAIYGPFDTVGLHIVQPAIDNIEEWEVPVSELRDFGPRIERIIEAARVPNAPFNPSAEACRFCRAKVDCRARAEANLSLARFEFAKPETLSEGELAEVLSKAEHLAKWASDVSSWALDEAERKGRRFPGFKLVRGRSTRVIADPVEAAERLRSAGFDDDEILTEPKLQTLTALEKVVGAKELTNVLGELIQKPLGRPVLVPVSDKREEISSTESAVSDFQS